jgi:hypothetical protein
MGHAIPRQQPAVVLRSHFDHLRALLAVALVAVVGLAVAVVILASDTDGASSTSAAKPVESTRGALPAQLPNTGYEPGTRDPLPAQLPNIGYEPGTRDPLPAQLTNTGYEPGTRDPLPAQLTNTGYEPQVGSTSAARAIEAVAEHDFSPATGRPEWLLPKWTPEEGAGLAREADGNWAHGPLPSDAPGKDDSKNAATGD